MLVFVGVHPTPVTNYDHGIPTTCSQIQILFLALNSKSLFHWLKNPQTII